MKSKKITINEGDKVKTTDGIGVVEKIVPGPFPFFVQLENGGSAWFDGQRQCRHPAMTVLEHNNEF